MRTTLGAVSTARIQFGDPLHIDGIIILSVRPCAANQMAGCMVQAPRAVSPLTIREQTVSKPHSFAESEHLRLRLEVCGIRRAGLSALGGRSDYSMKLLNQFLAYANPYFVKLVFCWRYGCTPPMSGNLFLVSDREGI